MATILVNKASNDYAPSVDFLASDVGLVCEMFEKYVKNDILIALCGDYGDQFYREVLKYFLTQAQGLPEAKSWDDREARKGVLHSIAMAKKVFAIYREIREESNHVPHPDVKALANMVALTASTKCAKIQPDRVLAVKHIDGQANTARCAYGLGDRGAQNAAQHWAAWAKAMAPWLTAIEKMPDTKKAIRALLAAVNADWVSVDNRENAIGHFSKAAEKADNKAEKDANKATREAEKAEAKAKAESLKAEKKAEKVNKAQVQQAQG